MTTGFLGVEGDYAGMPVKSIYLLAKEKVAGSNPVFRSRKAL